MYLENNPKQIRALIGLKPCFSDSMETQKGASKENLQFDDQSKQVDFLFCVAVFSKGNRKHVLRVSI